MTIDTHICLISGQPLPNLIPAFDPDLKPERMIQIVSPDMEQRAAWLRELLQPRGIKVEQWPVNDAWDIEHLQTRVLELLEHESRALEEQRIALNVTGGTKPMSIAAYESVRAYELPIFYVHPETDRVVWLHPTDWPPRDLADRIRIEDFLRAHGVAVTVEPGRNVPDDSLLQTGQEIIDNIDRYQKPLGSLNWLASEAEGNLLSPTVENPPSGLGELVELFEWHGFLKQEKGRLRFRDEAARFFVNGGWLEYFVFDAVRRIRRQDSHIHDVARSIEITRQQSGQAVPNELDVAFLRNNRLHLIECKTRKFRGQGEDAPGAEALYKLDTLADLTGGLQARAMLVSFQDIAGHDRGRARDLRIAVCGGNQLRHLERHLKDFITG